MHLWLLEQSINTGYDTFDSCVVVADTEHAARHTHPYGAYTWGAWITSSGRITGWGGERANGSQYTGGNEVWTLPDQVTATLLGTAEDPTPRVVCASFNAG